MLLKIVFGPILSKAAAITGWAGLKASLFAWEFADKYRMHERYGQAFVVVSPGENHIWCADPELTHFALTNKSRTLEREFVSRNILGLVGKNLMTVSNSFPMHWTLFILAMSLMLNYHGAGRRR
jgi:hypothetical protein